MSYRLKEFSYLTQGPVNLVVPWIEDENSFLYQTYKMINPGIIIEAETLYSLVTGKVIHVCHDRFGHYVTIQYDSNTCIRYCYLSECYVRAGQDVVYGYKVGQAKLMFKSLSNKPTCRIEFCSPEPSSFSVRFSRMTYYKHDPESLLWNEEKYQFDPDTQLEVSNDSFYDKSEQIQNAEFLSNGRGVV